MIAREECATRALIKEACESQDRCFFERAIGLHPCSVKNFDGEIAIPPPDPQSEVSVLVDGRPASSNEFGMQNLVYYDGSAFPGLIPEFNRAGWAAVEVNKDGTVTKAAYGTVPATMPQTSQAAEHVGRAYAIMLLNGPTTLHGDCENVVAMGSAPRHMHLTHKRLHTGATRAAIYSQCNKHLVQEAKVKAHVELSDALSPTSRRHAIANNAVDLLAKEAAKSHPSAPVYDTLSLIHI